jgi:hypothetical protein
MAQGTLQFVRLNQVISLGVCEFIEVNNTHAAVRVDDDICEQIGKDIDVCSVFDGVICLDNITVPADQPVLVVIELAYFEAALREIAGIAM